MRTCCAILSLLLIGTLASAGAVDVAIIVNKQNSVSEQSLNELITIFEQRLQFWKNGQRIHIILLESGRPERKVMLEKVFKRTDEQLKKYWLRRVFTGEIAELPVTLRSPGSVKRFVSQYPNAIGFIKASEIDDSVKVLRIDGKLPGDEDYILQLSDASR